MTGLGTVRRVTVYLPGAVAAFDSSCSQLAPRDLVLGLYVTPGAHPLSDTLMCARCGVAIGATADGFVPFLDDPNLDTAHCVRCILRLRHRIVQVNRDRDPGTFIATSPPARLRERPVVLEALR